MTAHGAALGAARKVTQPNPRNPYAVALQAQLDGLRRLEDPANESETAVVFREMLASADAAALTGGREARGWGAYNVATGDPRKSRTKAAT